LSGSTGGGRDRDDEILQLSFRTHHIDEKLKAAAELPMGRSYVGSILSTDAVAAYVPKTINSKCLTVVGGQVWGPSDHTYSARIFEMIDYRNIYVINIAGGVPVSHNTAFGKLYL
jgi:hypothetical protein